MCVYVECTKDRTRQSWIQDVGCYGMVWGWQDWTVRRPRCPISCDHQTYKVGLGSYEVACPTFWQFAYILSFTSLQGTCISPIAPHSHRYSAFLHNSLVIWSFFTTSSFVLMHCELCCIWKIETQVSHWDTPSNGCDSSESLLFLFVLTYSLPGLTMVWCGACLESMSLLNSTVFMWPNFLFLCTYLPSAHPDVIAT